MKKATLDFHIPIWNMANFEAYFCRQLIWSHIPNFWRVVMDFSPLCIGMVYWNFSLWHKDEARKQSLLFSSSPLLFYFPFSFSMLCPWETLLLRSEWEWSSNFKQNPSVSYLVTLTMCDFHNFGLIFTGQCTVCLKG